MKTVVVLVEYQTRAEPGWSYVTENSAFGQGYRYLTANDFINSVKELHQKHSYKYRITNVIIG